MKRRVYDLWNLDYGTAVTELSAGKYRVKWDEPTPYQDSAVVPIPSKYFVWADEPAQMRN